MTDLLVHPDPNDDCRIAPDCGSNTSKPRWVKVFGITAIVLVLLFVILHLTGVHGGHTSPDGPIPAEGRTLPGCHTPPDGHGGHDPSKWGH